MAEDILRELARLQQYASALQGLMAEAQAQSPRQADGVDSSGAVRVVLGPDGLPQSVRVEADWRRRLDPRSLGDAVLQAFQAATGQRMAAWTTTLQDEGWQGRVDRLRDEPLPEPPGDAPEPSVGEPSVPEPSAPEPSAASGPLAAPAPAVPEPRPVEPQTPPRAMDRVVEDVLHAMDHAERFANPPAFSAQGTGSAASGRLVVTLAKAGLVSCVVDPSWAAQQTAADLIGALATALARARADLARAAAAPDPAAALDGLFNEALGILHDPRRLTTDFRGDD